MRHQTIHATRVWIPFLIFLSIPLLALAQSSETNVRSAVEQILARQTDAWNHHDLDGFMGGYWNSPELTFFSNGAVTTGWEPTLKRYREKYRTSGRTMGKLEFSDLRIEELASDAAFVRGEFHLTMPDGKTPHGVFTLIFRKFPDGWKIVHDHTSSTP